MRFSQLLVILLTLSCMPLAAEDSGSNTARAFRQQFESLQPRLAASVFSPPLVLESKESSEHVSGDIYAAVNFRLSQIASVLQSPQRWCEILLLLSNTKRCQVDSRASHSYLVVQIGGKGEEQSAPDSANRFELNAQPSDPDVLRVQLSTDSGPMGSRQIRIQVEGVALTDQSVLLHLRYAYDTPWLARAAMGMYLHTLGRGKVGFTLVPSSNSKDVVYVDGVRGVMERNVVRYFMGLRCALTHADALPAQRFVMMSNCWFSAQERYPMQLYEMERSEYLSMKAHEYQASIAFLAGH